MKQKYALVRSVTKFNTDTVIFHLFVGSSSRDQIRKALIERFCDDMGFFFRIEDEDTSNLLEQRAHELRPESRFPLLWVKSASMGIERFYRELRDSNIECIEQRTMDEKGHQDLLHVLDAEYYFKKSRKTTNPSANQSQRKNLSQREKDERDLSIAMAVCLVALFILDIIVSNVFGI